MAVAFQPKGELIATGSSDGKLRLIDAATGDVERELPGDDTKINISQPRCVSFKPTGDATFASQIDYEWLIPFIRGADSSDGRTVVLPH